MFLCDLSVPHNPLVKLCSPGVELEEAPAWIVGHEDWPGGEMDQRVSTRRAVLGENGRLQPGLPVDEDEVSGQDGVNLCHGGRVGLDDLLVPDSPDI